MSVGVVLIDNLM